MTIGNFSEVIGDSGKNRISGDDLELVYGLGGNDKLKSKKGSSLEAEDSTFLVGGTGGDTYVLGKRASTVIFDTGKSAKDKVVAKGIGLNRNSSFIVEIDNRHIYAGDLNSGQYVFVLDWRKAANQIETFKLADGTISHQELVNDLKSLDNYLGNFSWQELEDAGEVDFDRAGLSIQGINQAIRQVKRRAKKLERNSSSSRSQSISRRSSDPLTGVVGEQWVGPERPLEGRSQSSFPQLSPEPSTASAPLVLTPDPIAPSTTTPLFLANPLSESSMGGLALALDPSF